MTDELFPVYKCRGCGTLYTGLSIDGETLDRALTLKGAHPSEFPRANNRLQKAQTLGVRLHVCVEDHYACLADLVGFATRKIENA